MSSKINSRLIICQLIREEKETLFGQFNPNLTKKKRETCWEEIRKLAISSYVKGLKERSWTYIRDSIWQACRRDAFTRKDKSKKSGEGIVQFTEVYYLFYY